MLGSYGTRTFRPDHHVDAGVFVLADLDPLAAGSPVSDGNPLAPCVWGVAEDCRRRVGELSKALDDAAALGLVDRVVQATGEAAPKDLVQVPKVADPAP